MPTRSTSTSIAGVAVRLVDRARASASARWKRWRRKPIIAPPPPRRRRSAPGRFEMLGVVSTWMEADIIGANVRNAFEQGCDRVFVIDNDSPDDTMERAVDAGAEPFCSFSTPTYDERLRCALIGHLIGRHTEEASDDVWWLLLDADEFPHGHRGATVRSVLETVDDDRVRTLGAVYLNHYPTGEPHYVVGDDPLVHQPMAELVVPRTFCRRHHRKHTLIRNGPGLDLVVPGLGFHSVVAPSYPVYEGEAEIVLHHFPFRREHDTRRRLDALYGVGTGSARAVDDGFTTMHMRARFESVDAIYEGRWSDVRTSDERGHTRGVDLEPWEQLLVAETRRRHVEAQRLRRR